MLVGAIGFELICIGYQQVTSRHEIKNLRHALPGRDLLKPGQLCPRLCPRFRGAIGAFLDVDIICPPNDHPKQGSTMPHLRWSERECEAVVLEAVELFREMRGRTKVDALQEAQSILPPERHKRVILPVLKRTLLARLEHALGVAPPNPAAPATTQTRTDPSGASPWAAGGGTREPCHHVRRGCRQGGAGGRRTAGEARLPGAGVA